MTKFDQAKRDKAVDACTSLLKKGHNVENTVAIIALGFLMNEMDDDEIAINSKGTSNSTSEAQDVVFIPTISCSSQKKSPKLLKKCSGPRFPVENY